jgi:hypothetical protein
MGNGLIALMIPPYHRGAYLTPQICSTLSEWEHISERFENAIHYSEKALYKLLKNHIAPAVVADLQVSQPGGVYFLLLKQCLGN